MPSRTAKFALAVVASLLAGAPFAIVSNSGARATDDCLSGPKGDTPEGSHWHYRVDHANQRQCWYLKQDGERVANATPNLTSAGKPASPKPEALAQRSIAEAHAELPARLGIDRLGTDRLGIDRPGQQARPAPATSAGPAINDISQNSKLPVAEAQPSVIASRWAGQGDADPATTSTAPATAAPDQVYAANAGAAPQTKLSPPPAAGQPTAADLPPETRTHSVQMLLAAILGALAVAAVMGRLIFNFVGTRRRAKRRVRGQRGAIWKTASTGRRKVSVYPGADALPRRTEFPRDLDQVGEPDDRIVELLRDFSRRGRQRQSANQNPNQRQRGVGSFL